MSEQARLHALVAQRERLRASFDHAWRQLPKTDQPALDAWAASAIELIEVNAGAACQVAFWSASAGGRGSLPLLASSGRAAAEICRHAGARATLACLESLSAALMMVGNGGGLRAWWQGLERLAREAPDCLPVIAPHASTLLADRSGQVCTDFVSAGLKAYARDAVRRRAFFSLEDRWARALLAQRPDVPGFEALSRMLAGFSLALWDDVATLQAAPLSDAPRPRASLSGRVLLLPASVACDSALAADRLYVATVAHGSAHLALPAVRHPVGQLKPMQIALIALIEDARIEALAMRRYPGLRHLWGPFHTAAASGPRTATNLMARLSRALFDAAHADPDGFVQKGRRMFAEAAGRSLDDPGLCLRIGRVLGHDLGQMRVQFNWRDYVIEPNYRDDGGQLWEAPDQPAEALDLMVQAGRANRAPGAQDQSGGDGEAAGRARQASADARGTIIASYPEWDACCAVERPDWTILRDVPPRAGNPATLRAAMDSEPALRARIARLVRSSTIGQPVRLKRQPDGDDLDMDAALDATIALRAGHAPDTRLFRLTRPRSRDLATVVLLDASASTAARLPDGRSVLDLQRLAVSLLAEALDGRGDPFALRAFASDGRHDVRLSRIKEFSEPFDAGALSRLAGLRPDLSTRLGTALRHARHEFGTSRAWRRLLLVLTDGEPSDVDVADNQELVLDARRAVLGLKQSGIDVFGVVLDPEGVGSATAIFGRANTIAIRNLADLPARLAGLYFRLALR